MSSQPPVLLGFGWYTPAQWSLLKAFAVDQDNLHDSYEVWLASANEGFAQLGASGAVRPVRIWVDVPELLAWCRERGLPFDGKARADFLLEKTQHGSFTPGA